jgi:hypothetical protein
MRHVKLLAISLSLLVLASCKKSNETSGAPECEGDCLFVVVNARATMTKMGCFDRFGLIAKHPDTGETIYGIPDYLSSKYMEEGKKVKFSALFRPNSLVPSFPDPSVGPESVYQINIADIRSDAEQ